MQKQNKWLTTGQGQAFIKGHVRHCVRCCRHAVEFLSHSRSGGHISILQIKKLWKEKKSFAQGCSTLNKWLNRRFEYTIVTLSNLLGIAEDYSRGLKMCKLFNTE